MTIFKERGLIVDIRNAGAVATLQNESGDTVSSTVAEQYHEITVAADNGRHYDFPIKDKDLVTIGQTVDCVLYVADETIKVKLIGGIFERIYHKWITSKSRT
jgi:hypothetical protein